MGFPTFSQLIISDREASKKNKKPRGPLVPSGMLDNWDSKDLYLLPQAQARSRSTTSVGSWRTSDVDTMDIDHPSESIVGNIPSDDDEVEHKELEVATRVMNKGGPSGVRFRVRTISHFLNIDTSTILVIFI